MPSAATRRARKRPDRREYPSEVTAAVRVKVPSSTPVAAGAAPRLWSRKGPWAGIR